MNIVFNVIVIGLVGLIAYWWANQGLFSALLHLVCVIVAGALALGLWEPIVMGALLRGTWFDSYIWGVTLVLVFAISLFGLRFAIDKLVPGNIDLPHWANLAFGFPIGALAGILTMGILVIGCGFIQSHVEIMGYRGYGPSQNGTISKYSTKSSMWFPVHQITAEFYGWLSVTSMWSPKPLQRYYPQLHWQASLIRCTYEDGVGQISMPPKSASVRDFYLSPDNRTAVVHVRFEAGSLDFGEQLVLSNAQIRLISTVTGARKAKVEYPRKWIQNNSLYVYDDFTHYATSTPGQEGADLYFFFTLPSDFVPGFIQVKGNRYRLPQPADLPPSLAAGAMPTLGTVEEIPTGGTIMDSVVEVTADARPIRVSSNAMPGTMEVKEQPGGKKDEKRFYSGFGTFHSRGKGGMIARNLAIDKLYEAEGTRMVRIDVSRGGLADIFKVQDRVTPTDQLRIIDDSGQPYSPIGYFHDKANGEYDLKLVPGQFLRTFDQLPYLPTTNTHTLKLYFRVTEGVNIVAFKYGDVTIGTCNVEVPAKP